VQYALFLLLIVGCFGVPVFLIMGWCRLRRCSSPQGRLSVISLAGFALGSASALLAVGSILYCVATGGFRYYDPTVLKIYRAGLLLALGGLACALVGVWNRNPLRWHAPALSLGMLLLWLIWASGE
jgi:hypothetical protein